MSDAKRYDNVVVSASDVSGAAIRTDGDRIRQLPKWNRPAWPSGGKVNRGDRALEDLVGAVCGGGVGGDGNTWGAVSGADRPAGTASSLVYWRCRVVGIVGYVRGVVLPSECDGIRLMPDSDRPAGAAGGKADRGDRSSTIVDDVGD